MLISIVTIFPDLFAGVFDFGMIRQGRKKELLETEIVDLREFAPDERKTVDDRPYGGGEGMVLKPELIFEAVEKCQEKWGDRGRVILLSPQGERFDQKKAKELSLMPHLILICGRYEDVDQRVADYLADEELSVGDFVLSGGEFAACLVVDFPHYTRPAEFRGWKVPDILLSGDHVRIQRWRRQKALERTQQRRPDLLKEESGLEEQSSGLEED
jgi:tRNA (guanine37-N1)-methyltransferase